MDHKKEPGDFADKKLAEQVHGVIIAAPDAHNNEGQGLKPSGSPSDNPEK